jgi:hypothetical protein
LIDRRINWIRWCAVLPCALLATVIVQIGAEAVIRYVLVASVGLESWTPWVAKGVASLLMAAVFISFVWCIAPRAKFQVAGLALAAVIVWGASLVLRSFEENNPDWLLAMGVAGAVGGLLAFVGAWWIAAAQARQ